MCNLEYIEIVNRVVKSDEKDLKFNRGASESDKIS